MNLADTPMADYRQPLERGFVWNAMDADDRWAFEVRIPTPLHHDGLLAVEARIVELMVELGFAVNPVYGDPVQA